MRLSRAAALVAAATLLAVAGCGPGDPRESEAFADAVRALAGRARGAHPDVTLRVHDRRPTMSVGEDPEEPLPWAARQALTTAGFELVDSGRIARVEDAVLHLLHVEQQGEAWKFRIYLQRSWPELVPGTVFEQMDWTVTCAAGCTLSDSVHHGHGDGILREPDPAATGS